MTTIPLMDDWVCRTPRGPFSMGDDTSERVVRLPHDALRDAERSADVPAKGAAASYPDGAFSYVRALDAPAEWAGRVVRLEIQGAHRRAQVFVNDEFAGNRADGYARFFVDITAFLQHGERNEIRIEVRSGQDSRWYSGAGLHRPVVLHVDEPIHVVPDGVVVTTARIEGDQAVVDVVTEVANAGLVTRTVHVATEIADPDGAVVEGDDTPVTLAPGAREVVRQRLYIADPRLWSPDGPELHRATVRVGDGAPVEVAFGIRTVTADPNKGLRINGEPVLLRGACVHHDNGPLGAAAIGRAEERRIELLKEAGFNAIRGAHNPVSPAMLDACDRLGMLVMDEAFDMWTRFKTPYDYAAEFPQWWAADIDAMVAKDRNHPSVIMYSIGNEIIETGTPHGARWARRLAERVRAADPTRLVTNGVNAFLSVIDELGEIRAGLEQAGGLNEAMSGDDGPFAAVAVSATATRRIEESSAAVDVLGLNYAEARYGLDSELHPHRIIVGSETFSTQIGTLWPLVKTHPHVIGDFTWTGWDYLGEVGIGSTVYADDESARAALEREHPWLTAWCGDIDITGFRRPASYYREIAFGLRTDPFIAVSRPENSGREIALRSPWAWSDTVASWSWAGHEGTPTAVEVYADADEVELRLDGEVLGRAAVGERMPLVADLRVAYRPGRLTAVAFRGGVEVGETSLTTAGATRLTAIVDRDQLRDDAADLAFCAIELRDDRGILVTGVDRDVTVSVTGSAELAGMSSARPATEERFDQATWRTFDGRVLAVVRPTGAGDAVIEVTSPRLDPVRIPLTIR
ncbi:glycoside hydrolase family 2 TIM barrel-domain containing protein [Microbacterium karelineae]|uniref:glycoside hydrolase family 2 TIM barrel-domain containing protein n=1 Tax=Microbacterium karelineae TaxID=2654283 RepID=UPI0012EA5067|nr:glycoside hydrolase family 2 TIM barrel-domain containing protein [Microbacterium karelineae]